jgi:hypothetical protein
MKVIDQSPVRADTQPFDKFKVYLNGVLKFGWGWIADIKAEEAIIASLGRYIDNTYIIARNVLLEGIDVPIPLVLVGPSGVYMLLASGATGLFRARNEIWMELNRKSRKYTPVRKNMITRAQLMTQVIDAYLIRHQCQHPPIQTAMLFGDAGAHVDSVRSAVRIVLKDGFERFANSVVQGKTVLNSKDEIQKIVDVLTGNLPISEEDLSEPVPVAPGKPTPVDKLVKATKRLGLTTRQWVMLGVMAFFEALILILIFVFITVMFS